MSIILVYSDTSWDLLKGTSCMRVDVDGFVKPGTNVKSVCESCLLLIEVTACITLVQSYADTI